MAGSKNNPAYGVYLLVGTTQYDLTPCVEAIKFTDEETQFSKKMQVELANVQVNGQWLNSIIRTRQRIYVYANDGGETSDEVWRGFVWELGYKSSTNVRFLVLNCYDNLIYMQESEESEFFPSGKSTKDVMISICTKWGVAIDYSYASITHEKLALRGKLSDIITADILDLVKEREGKKYVVLSEKDVMWVREVGQNTTVYRIEAGNNACTTESKCTMEGMTTKVVILGKADDDDRRPVEATVTGDTAKYGTLQKIITRDENTSLDDSKKEGDNIIKENGEPKWEYTVEAPDIPWIRKGDKVYVNAGSLLGYYIVKGIAREITNTKKTMLLTMEDVQ